MRSNYGRFQLVGDEGAFPGRGFGNDVAIDGDVAVVAAPNSKESVPAAAHVYERGEEEWRLVARLERPQSGSGPYGMEVACSRGRVLVVSGDGDAGSRVSLRTYVRDADGRWTLEAEVPVGDPSRGVDAALCGEVAVVGSAVFRLREGAWRRVQTIEPPPEVTSGGFAVWTSLAADTLAMAFRDNDNGVCVFRDREGSFSLETTLACGFEPHLFGCLGRGGSALLTTNEPGVLRVDERRDDTWTRTLVASKQLFGPIVTLYWHPIAADGDLAIVASRDVNHFQVLQRREDGWYRAEIGAPARPAGQPAPKGFWPAWHPNVAMSGRAAVVSTGWDPAGSGRVWFLEVTDDDLARAVKIEPDTSK